ncbi:hypothetical protein DY000_02009178 [Brassica cretica]|uniref:F-box domain-containing protein n=1 Tax=Brassica cretica TaxID=69181 RepID=A0ABQ7BU18_BRACR|nr:hypothetical protein DY000_02009178 [Brassica cretica]
MLYSWVQAVASAATSLIVEPPWKKRKPNPPPPLSFLSLPDVIILNCLARVSRSYYPKLSLVSKTFRSLILSIDLNHARFHHQKQEDIFYICLQLPDRPLPTWFTLWIKPDEEEVKKRSIFVQVPSSYDSREPLSYCTVGSDLYALRQSYPPSPSMFVRNKKSVVWRNAPNMTVPRAYPVACKIDGKIYVMGGCNDDKSKKSCWGEVFDTNTQTWETLPNPKAELRFSSMIRETQIIEGKIYVRSIDEIDSVYDPKTRKWDATEKALVDKSYCRRGLIETVEYCGKLLIIWDKFAQPRRYCHEKTICCALVAFEKRQNGQVWGKVEWSNAGLTVPSSYVYMRYLVNVL